MKLWLWRILLLVFGLFVGFVSFVAYTNLVAKRAGEGALFDEVADVPSQAVGVVFGTTPTIGARQNLYFEYRMNAAAELWKEGKVQCLLVSGDNSEKYYNEPLKMRDALVGRGVPAEKIVLDYAGFRTLDTVVRAKKVFGAPSAVVVSQRFHNERALYLARAQGWQWVGYNAKDVQGSLGLKVQMREIFARVKMWLDIRILGTKPRYLGPKESLPL